MAKAKRITNIQIKNLFGEFNFDWSIPQEQPVVVLVGKNGMGKTTILNAILTLFANNNLLKDDIYNSVKISVLTNGKTRIKRITKTQAAIMFDEISKIESIYTRTLNVLSKQYEEMSDEFYKVKNLLKDVKDIRNELYLSVAKDPKYLPDTNVSKFKITGDISMKLVNISTIDLLANSTREFKNSSGNNINFLNEEITEYFNRIKQLGDVEKIQNLKNVLNDFFIDTSKQIVITDKNDLQIINKSKLKLKLSDLSSGERQLIFIFLKIFMAEIDQCDLVLMDEPEISLHLGWQKKLLSELIKINNYSQMIVVTHSPALVINGWRDSYIDMKDLLKPNRS